MSQLVQVDGLTIFVPTHIDINKNNLKHSIVIIITISIKTYYLTRYFSGKKYSKKYLIFNNDSFKRIERTISVWSTQVTCFEEMF